MQSQQIVNGNFVTDKAGLTGLSGAATTFSTGNSVTYALGGKAFIKAAVAGGATPTVNSLTGAIINVAAGFGTVLLWCFDATGAIKVVRGTTEALDPNSNGFQFAPPSFPLVTDDLVPFAYSIHKNAAGSAAFVVGTSQWNQAGSTHTVQDIITLPGRPQTA